MRALDWIQRQGVGVYLEQTMQIRLEGLDALDTMQAQEIVEFAKENKARLVAELRAQYNRSADPMCKHCKHHSVACICNGPCTAKGLFRDPEWFACHAFEDKFPRRPKRYAYFSGKGCADLLQ